MLARWDGKIIARTWRVQNKIIIVYDEVDIYVCEALNLNVDLFVLWLYAVYHLFAMLLVKIKSNVIAFFVEL